MVSMEKLFNSRAIFISSSRVTKLYILYYYWDIYNVGCLWTIFWINRNSQEKKALFTVSCPFYEWLSRELQKYPNHSCTVRNSVGNQAVLQSYTSPQVGLCVAQQVSPTPPYGGSVWEPNWLAATWRPRHVSWFDSYCTAMGERGRVVALWTSETIEWQYVKMSEILTVL